MSIDSSAYFHLKFIEAIKSLSEEKTDFRKACNEWKFVKLTSGNVGRCICTHVISNEYLIKNEITSATAYVGSECINNFMLDNPVLKQAAKIAKSDKKRELDGKIPAVYCKMCKKIIKQKKGNIWL
jgi:hypothetical protein